GVAAGFNVLDGDAVPGRTASGSLPAGYEWARLDGPAWGSVACSVTGDCTYRPLDGHAGADSFRYSVTNPLFGAAAVEVSLEVLHVNDAPVARDDRAVTSQGEPVIVEVTNNDEDPNDPPSPGDPNRPGDPPRVAAAGPVDPPGSGSVECTPAACTYTPAPGFTGTAAFTYTVTDLGQSDPRVDDPGIEGGIAAVAPLSAEAQVRVWVDPPPQQAAGFSDAVEGVTATGAGTWDASTELSVDAGCPTGRPQVTVAWEPVPNATAYRIERRPVDAPAGTDRWVERATAPGSGFVDDLVGEGRAQRYRVTPLRHRLAGQPSEQKTAAVPPATGPGGC
ncbi:MAG TPA: Ig-like domain-containing protein, partial [Actinomycetota bacterium]|nr:Ig-like domain-containing protein [Actinomycetota bacterium]